MKNWFGILSSLLLTYPQLYPGYVLPEEKLNWGPVKLGLGVGWILLFICISILVLVYFLLWKGARFHEGKGVDH
jgi:hypothetical protein